MKRVIAWMLIPVLGLVAPAAGVWIYAGNNTSLETALRLATHWLPPGHSVQFSNVQGSVREGGRIGSLRWQHDGLGVQASDITVAWSLAPLLNHTVQLQQLHIATLQIDDQRAPKEPQPQTRWRYRCNSTFRSRWTSCAMRARPASAPRH